MDNQREEDLWHLVCDHVSVVLIYSYSVAGVERVLENLLKLKYLYVYKLFKGWVKSDQEYYIVNVNLPFATFHFKNVAFTSVTHSSTGDINT